MIILVDGANILQAATIHSISWQESHRTFCATDFVEMHTPERQQAYLEDKIKDGSKVYILVDEDPVGIVSVTDNLIEDLYVLPDKQSMGYGTKLLQFAVGQCIGTPTLWILENNMNAERLYRRMGFEKTGSKKPIKDGLDEIEYALTCAYLRRNVMMNPMIACCGLNCETCEARLATIHHDDALREKVAKLWSELNGVEITPEMINCVGCRIDGVKTPYCESLCPIRQCATSRGMETCGNCGEIESCEKLRAITEHNSDALKRLKTGV